MRRTPLRGIIVALAAVTVVGQGPAVGGATSGESSAVEAAATATTADGLARPFSQLPVGQAPCPSGTARSGTYASDIGDSRVPQSRFATGWVRDTGSDRIAGRADLMSSIRSGDSRRRAWFHLDPMTVTAGRSTHFAVASKGTLRDGQGRISLNDRLLTPGPSSSYRGHTRDITSATTTEGGELYPWVELRAPAGTSSTWQLDNMQIFTCRDAAVSRVSGSNRYATATALSRSAFSSGVQTVVVASGENFPDALSGSALAASFDGPLLITHSDRLSPQARDEVQRLDPQRVIVLGGTAAVTADVVRDLEGIVPTVTRVGGANRYGTSQEAATFFDSGGHVVVATGAAFPDALSGGALADRKSAPVLLTRRDELNPATVDALNELDPAGITVLGGESAVSAAVVSALRDYAPVTRIGGGNRYETSALIAAEFGSSPSRSYLTTGMLFPDALTTGPVASAHDAPVLLTRPSQLPGTVNTRLRAMSESRGVVVGGSTRVGAIVRDRYGRTLP